MDQLRRLPCRVLVDCNSIENYISTIIAKRLGIKAKVIKGESIYLADEQKNMLSKTSEEEILRLSDTYALMEKFTVTKLRYDIILGMPWLEVKKKQIDQVVRTISFKDSECKVAFYIFALTEEKKILCNQRLTHKNDLLKKQIQYKQLIYMMVLNLVSVVGETAKGVEQTNQFILKYQDVFLTNLPTSMLFDQGSSFYTIAWNQTNQLLTLNSNLVASMKLNAS